MIAFIVLFLFYCNPPRVALNSKMGSINKPLAYEPQYTENQLLKIKLLHTVKRRQAL